LPQVEVAFNKALRHVYIVSVCLSCIAIVAALGVEWRPIQKQKPGEAEKGPQPPPANLTVPYFLRRQALEGYARKIGNWFARFEIRVEVKRRPPADVETA
jgi:hypothetical protein